MSERQLAEVESFLREARRDVVYWGELTADQFREELARIMKRRGMSRAELARRIDSSSAYVTKVLNGTHGNFGTETMAKFALALGMRVHVHMAPPDCYVTWVHRRSSGPSVLEIEDALGPRPADRPYVVSSSPSGEEIIAA